MLQTDEKFPLHRAAKQGDLYTCQKLISENFSAQQLDASGKQAIFYASMGNTNQYSAIIKLLVDHGGSLIYGENDERFCLLDIAKNVAVKKTLREIIVAKIQIFSHDPIITYILVSSIYRTLQDNHLVLNKTTLEMLNLINVSEQIYATIISEVFLDSEDYDDLEMIQDSVGFEACQQALQYYEGQHDSKTAAKIAYHMAGFAANNKDNNQAELLYRKALEYSERSGINKKLC